MQLAERPALSVGDRLKDSLFYFPLVLGAVILIALMLIVLFGPMFAPHNPYLIDRIVLPHYDFETEEYIRIPVPPGDRFLLGSDQRGMDIVSLLLYGARNTIIAGFLIAAARVGIGLFAGMIMGWNENKWIDRFLLGLIGVLTSIPALIGAMILIYSLGIRGGMSVFVVALTVVGWTEVAQYMRSEVLVLRKMPFIEGARVVGTSENEMLLRHIFPNILPQLFVISFLEIGSVLMLVGELALVGVFIGGGSTLDLSDLMAPPTIVGIPTQPEWGAMVASGFRWFRSYPHVVMMPAIAIFLSVLGFNAFGEGLRAFFEKRGVKATFLLGKRIVFILLGVGIVIFVVLNSTRPSRWFEEMASGFQSQRALEDKNSLESLSSSPPSSDGIFPGAEQIGAEFDANGFRGGIRWSNPIYVRQAEYFEAGQPPLLQMLNGDGKVVVEFSGLEEIAFLFDTHGGPGTASAPVVALVFPSTPSRLDNLLQGVDLQGKILLLYETNISRSISGYLVEQGAAGLIWIAPDSAINNPALRVVSDDEQATVPMVRLSHAAGEQLLAAEGESLLLFDPQDTAMTVQELVLSARLQVELPAPKDVELNSIVTYRPGTDADLGDEIVLIFAMCDGMWRSDDVASLATVNGGLACPAPYMLELSRLLNENLIDTRRPIVFVLWGGSEFGREEFIDWLLVTPNSYEITAPGMRLSPRVTVSIQLIPTEISSPDLTYLEGSHPALVEAIEDAAREIGHDVTAVETTAGLPVWFFADEVLYQAAIQIDMSGNHIQTHGETLALILIRLVREDILSGD